MLREIRILSIAGLEVRSEGDSKSIRGYAAKFDVLSENLGGFREQIKPGAFADVLDNDVRALVNHDPNLILGRNKSGTLDIGQDETGLWYEAKLPDTQAARDLAQSISRGDINQSSFAFSVASGGQDWSEDDDGRIIRTITKFSRLYDVSAVTYPAYPDATVGMRGLDGGNEAMAEYRKARDARAYEARKRQERSRFIRLKASHQ
ncbi:MAG: HK97 family phage prohead protease [Burkholderiales bacterium]|nr:HK97 family phage prohead protease [Dokdonella sp.]MCW5603693.1 HK97 family phage prohead protease [Burkholderiales bacterium]